MRTFLIFLFVAGVTLFIYNPELGDFEKHIEEILFQEQQEKNRSSLVGRTLEGERTTFNVNQVARSTQRNNFFLYSTYQVVLGEPEDAEEELPQMQFLGIAGMFFRTDG